MTSMSSLSPVLMVSPCASLNSDAVLQKNNDDDNIDAEAIGRIFETQSEAIEKWLREKAPPELVTRLHSITDELRTGPEIGNNAAVAAAMFASQKRASVTSELFNQWMSASPKVSKIVQIVK